MPITCDELFQAISRNTDGTVSSLESLFDVTSQDQHLKSYIERLVFRFDVKLSSVCVVYSFHKPCSQSYSFDITA